MSLELDIEQLLPRLFNGAKRLDAHTFWVKMEDYAKEIGKIELDGEFYRTVSLLYEKGVLGLEAGCYYLKENRK